MSLMMNHSCCKQITEIEDVHNTSALYTRHFAGCLIRTQDGRLLLQQRGHDWDRFPGVIATFGGQVDPGEEPEQGMARELLEELGANVQLPDLVRLGAFTKRGLSRALIHAFWWEDSLATITGCYEGHPAYFKNAQEILATENITPDVYWIVMTCLKRGLIS